VQVHSPGEHPAPPWRTLRSLWQDGGLLDARVDFVDMTLRAGGHDISPRVAASVVQLGLCGRILAPALATQTFGLGPLHLDADALWCQDDLGGAYPLSVGVSGSTDLLDGVITDLAGLFGERYGVPPRTLWGNIASTINSAARQLALARPDLAEAAERVAASALRDPRLEGGTLRAGPGFRRRSCCLIYQASGSRTAICGDCVLGLPL
jgi:hypothetical protein